MFNVFDKISEQQPRYCLPSPPPAYADVVGKIKKRPRIAVGIEEIALVTANHACLVSELISVLQIHTVGSIDHLLQLRVPLPFSAKEMVELYT